MESIVYNVYYMKICWNLPPSMSLLRNWNPHKYRSACFAYSCAQISVRMKPLDAGHAAKPSGASYERFASAVMIRISKVKLD